jgi:hypothetical protein
MITVTITIKFIRWYVLYSPMVHLNQTVGKEGSYTALSDDSLEENWYRFVSDNGDEMCTYPPGVLSCGTYYPIWLNGKLYSPSSWS